MADRSGTDVAVELLARQIGGAMYPHLNEEAQGTVREGARKLLDEIDAVRSEPRIVGYVSLNTDGTGPFSGQFPVRERERADAFTRDHSLPGDRYHFRTYKIVEA